MIVRNPTKERYTVISNAALEDVRLSLKAKGLLAYLLTKPDGWKVIVIHLVKQSNDGRYAIEKALDELETFGYIVRTPQKRSDSGKFDGIDTEVHERPIGGWPTQSRAPHVPLSEEASLPDSPPDDVPPCAETGNGCDQDLPVSTVRGYPSTENPSTGNRELVSTDVAIPDEAITDFLSFLEINDDDVVGSRALGEDPNRVGDYFDRFFASSRRQEAQTLDDIIEVTAK
jgi:hypothetical protein